MQIDLWYAFFDGGLHNQGRSIAGATIMLFTTIAHLAALFVPFSFARLGKTRSFLAIFTLLILPVLFGAVIYYLGMQYEYTHRETPANVGFVTWPACFGVGILVIVVILIYHHKQLSLPNKSFKRTRPHGGRAA